MFASTSVSFQRCLGDFVRVVDADALAKKKTPVGRLSRQEIFAAVFSANFSPCGGFDRA